MTRTARGEFVVSSRPLTFEGAEPEYKPGRMSIDKQISGDLTGSTTGQMLGAMIGTTNHGAPSHVVSVVADSGTGELVGLEGEFKIDIERGKHFYEFTYRLPAD